MTDVGPVGGADDERDAVQRRTLRVLATGQVLGSAGLTSGLAVGGLIARDLLGGDTLAGLATAFLTLGSAAGAARLSQLMVRRGRRPGLVVGYLVAVGGAVTAIAAAQVGWFWLLLVGQVMLGAGQSSNLLARYAAADLARPERRAQAISLLVFASTFGAVSGPALVGVGERAGEAAGIEPLAGAYLFSIVFFTLAATVAFTLLRPDPLVLAGGVQPGRHGRNRTDLAGALAVVWEHRPARLALASMAVSQAVMVAVMTMTPLHMKGLDHSVQTIGWVLAVHIAGMYTFAPIIGWFTDRRGPVTMIVVGAVTLMVATGVTALASQHTGGTTGASHDTALLFAGLFLLGVGWSFGLVAGSSLLSSSVPLVHRAHVQGAADLCMSLCGGLAGLASGFIKAALSFAVLAELGLLAAAGLVLVAALSARRPALVGSG